MIKIVEKPEEQKNDSLELSVKDTICCWNDDDASVAKNYLKVAQPLCDYCNFKSRDRATPELLPELRQRFKKRRYTR